MKGWRRTPRKCPRLWRSTRFTMPTSPRASSDIRNWAIPVIEGALAQRFTKPQSWSKELESISGIIPVWLPVLLPRNWPWARAQRTWSFGRTSALGGSRKVIATSSLQQQGRNTKSNAESCWRGSRLAQTRSSGTVRRCCVHCQSQAQPVNRRSLCSRQLHLTGPAQVHGMLPEASLWWHGLGLYVRHEVSAHHGGCRCQNKY